MSDPTRGEIEATVTQPTYQVEYWNGSAWTAVADSAVLSVAGDNDSGGGSSGLDFGAGAAPRFTVTLEDNSTTAAITWAKTRVRVRYGFASSNQLTRHIGVINGRGRQYGEVPTLVWDCSGFDQTIRDTAIYSPMFYRRLAATATTASSVEDPTNSAYAGGLVNYIFWQAGGRPLAQSGTYPSATFYYTCQSALIAPEWTWIAGEDAWQELDRLCRAVGGQVFQQPDGTMVFVNVLAPTASGYAVTEANYRAISEDATTDEYFTQARCSYTARALQPLQVVYEDTTPRLIAPSGTLTFTVEPQLPVYDWFVSGTSTIPSDCYVITDLFGYSITATVTYVSRAAARVEVSFVNGDSTRPLLISRLSLKGRPVAPIEEGQASYGSGTPARAIGDGEIYVQSRSHAERLCRIYVDIYGQVRPTRRLTTMGYDPDRTVGEVIGLTCAAWSLSAVDHRIAAIQVSETGALMDLAVAPITGIPTTAALFMIGTTYSGSDTRELGY
jgi:hypothetical protein